ncbi:uncharacterized protein LOC5502888 [Nematostella vectensis]|uniref:uncharacterized protein LOC5502888 n=1 Tax=Nematostella vectensis TaxID=45351 RepID=UPI002076E701|nr:uncharacterized protein LOC5502888 [Nematostella vectensis]
MQKVNENEQTDTALTEKMSFVLDSVLATGLNEQSLAKRKESIRRPENCKLLKVNSEIWEIAQKTTKSMDARLQKLQEALIKGLIPMARAAGLVGEALSKKADMPLTLEELWKGLSYSVLFVAPANHDLNMCRCDLFKVDLDDKYKEICSNKEPVASELFGDDLGECLKTVKESKKAAQQLTGKRKRDEEYPRRPRPSYGGNFLFPNWGRPYRGRPHQRYNPQNKYPSTHNTNSAAKSRSNAYTV